MNDGANVLAIEGELDVPFLLEIKNDDWNIIIHTETEGGRIHDTKFAANALSERDGLVANGIRIFFWDPNRKHHPPWLL
jgi:hypothetical protein